MGDPIVEIITKDEAKDSVIDFLVGQGFKERKIGFRSSSKSEKGWHFKLSNPPESFTVDAKGMVIDDGSYFSKERAKEHNAGCDCIYCGTGGRQ